MASTVPASDIASKFPSSVWEEIFRHLSGLQLLEFRLLCRNWRTIIDGCPALMKRILLRFPAGSVLDRDYEPDYLVPARNLVLEKVRISAVNTWWPEFAQKLIFLHLNDCKVSAGTLLQLFKPMTNLKVLQLSNMEMMKNPSLTVNIKLDELEKLTLHQLKGDIMEILAPIFTQLSWIEFPNNIAKEPVIEILRLNRTLKGVTLDYTPEMLNEILKLKQLTYLEVRTGEMNSQNLTAIGNELPNLKSINVNLTTDTTQLTFLDAMPGLEEIYLTSSRDVALDFADAKSPNLVKFKLLSCKPTFNSLFRYFGNSPKIIDICFVSCRFSSWFEVFAALELYSHSLQRLELTSVAVSGAEDRLSEYFDGLKYLHLYSCHMSKTLLLDLIGLCPELEEVYLEYESNFDGEVMLALCKKLKRLEKLTLRWCKITDTIADHIVEHCHALKQLTINEYYFRLSDGAKNKLKALENVRFQFE